MDSQDTPAVTAANKGRNSGVAVVEAHAGTSEVFLTETTRSKMIGRKDAHETTSLANQIVPVGVCSGQVATNSPSHTRALKPTRFEMIPLIRKACYLLFGRSVRTYTCNITQP